MAGTPYEKPPRSREQQVAERRKRERYAPPVLATLVKRAKLRADAEADILSKATLEDCCAKLADAVPSIEAHLEAYEAAQDPENDIEDEYHPKHDKVYCWRALRLIVGNHLAWFAEMHKADLDVAVKKLQARHGKPKFVKTQVNLAETDSQCNLLNPSHEQGQS